MIKKILVTGSNGVIGTRLTELLLSHNFSVTGVDMREQRWSPAVGSVTRVADIRNPATFETLPSNIDLVIHLAANARVHDLVQDPQQALDNMLMTYNVLEFARRHAIPRIMHASSREVYGVRDNPTNDEKDVRIEACPSPYAASKISDEAFVRAYHTCYGISFMTLRFSTVYGMYDTSDRLLVTFQRRAQKNEDLIVFGEDKLLDFCHIDDTVAGILQGIEKFEQAKNDVYNLGSGVGTHLVDAAKLIIATMNSSSTVITQENRPGEVMAHILDITKARDTLGYEPRIHWTEGVRQTVAWYRENPAAL